MRLSTTTESPARPDPIVGREAFRNGMARLGAAVNIITTDGSAGRAGFTASAVCSVTDTPPTLLVCLNRLSSVHDVFTRNSAICVNVVNPEQEALSRLFGGKTPMDDRFAAARWSTRMSGAPMLEGATVAFDCQVSETSEIGTHTVLYCEVCDVVIHEVASCLVYFDRRFHKL